MPGARMPRVRFSTSFAPPFSDWTVWRLGVVIKKNKDNTKFKVRCSKYLYTIVIADKDKAEKLKQALPSSTSRFLYPFILLFSA